MIALPSVKIDLSDLPNARKSVTIVPPGAGQEYISASARTLVRLAATETGGAVSVLEMTIGPGQEIPPHIQENEHVAFYVLDGNVTFQSIFGAVDAPAGSFYSAPRGSLRAYRNNGVIAARLLVYALPGGLDRFYTEAKASPDAAAGYGISYRVAGDLATGELLGGPRRLATTHAPQAGIPHFVAPDAGDTFGIMTGRLRTLAPVSVTGGAYHAFEEKVRIGAGVPMLHIHERESEVFYVVEGEVAFWSEDGNAVTVGAGGLVFGPSGVPHAFRNTGDRPARMIILLTPGGDLSDLFAEIAVPAPDPALLAVPAPPPEPEQIQAVIAAAARQHIRFVG